MEESLWFDQEWLLVNALRQALGIARRRTPTYAEAVDLVLDLAPQLLMEDSPLVEAFETKLERLYKERAAARSEIEGKEVTPLEVLDRDIEQLEEETRQAEPDQAQEIEIELSRLARARSRLDKESWTESKAITRDSDASARNLPVSVRGQGYKVYELAMDRRLRVRVLHPDPPEARSGVDLMYETYWDKNLGEGRTALLVRIAALQYKMWDGKALYTSRYPDLRDKMEKMRRAFCDAGLCNPPKKPGADERYRLPFCCAFLRPTDRVQTRDAWRISHAWHIPVCAACDALEPTGQGHEVLRSRRISSSAITQETFQELYNRYMLGSRWLIAQELDELYDRIGVFNDVDRVIVHAQEYSSHRTTGHRRGAQTDVTDEIPF
jgi:hypothetical protein